MMSTARRTQYREDEVGWRRRRERDEGWWRDRDAAARSSQWSSSKRGKPPPSPRSWIPTVPSWEKRFCTAICGVPWKKICESKEMLSCYSNVAEWDDSAGKEAFENAKAKFYAEINGLTCQISPPGPDIFIDDINWNPEMDHELVLELDRVKNQAYQISSDTSYGLDTPIPCSGWEYPSDDPNMDPWEREVRRMKREEDLAWYQPWRLEDCFLKVVDKTYEVDGQKNLGDDDHHHQGKDYQRRRR